jgi:hypothetical protein
MQLLLVVLNSHFLRQQCPHNPHGTKKDLIHISIVEKLGKNFVKHNLFDTRSIMQLPGL